MNIDYDQARELELFYENDAELYQNSQAFVKNYNLKKSKGKYVHSLAVRGIKNTFLSKVIRKYNKDVGNIGMVNSDTKEYLAERWVKEYEGEYH